MTLDWLAPPELQVDVVPFLGRAGVEPIEGTIRYVAPPIPLKCYLPARTIEERRTQLDAAAAALLGPCEFRVSDAPDKVGYGLLRRMAPALSRPAFLRSGTLADFTITRENPFWFDRVDRTLTCPAAEQPKRVPCGSHSHGGRIWVMDDLDERTIEQLNGQGTVIRSMTLTGELYGEEYFEIDNDRHRVWHVAGTVRTDVTGTAPGLTDDFFTFDPRDDPWLRHAEGGDLVHLYRRAFLV